MSKSGYIVICTVDRDIYRLNDGNVFANPGEASDCMLSDFKNDFENHMLDNYEPDEIEQIMEQIDDFDYDDGDCGISATEAYLTTGDKNYDWSIINVYFDETENSDEEEALYKRAVEGFYCLDDCCEIIEHDGRLYLLTEDEGEICHGEYDSFASYKNLFYDLEIDESIENDVEDWANGGDLYEEGIWSYPVSLEDIKALIEDGAKIDIDEFIKED